MSTDRLGRHPGRPWRVEGEVPKHVSAHYLSLSADELVDDLLSYQRKMWPTIERVVVHRLEATSAPRLAFEGSALIPKNAGNLTDQRVKTLCLTAEPDFLRARIYQSSGYESATAESRQLIDKFVERNQLLNDVYAKMAEAYGVEVVDVGTGISVGELVELSLG